VRAVLARHWFTGCLVAAIAVGCVWPAPGCLVYEGLGGVHVFIVTVLFLSAVSLKTSAIVAGFRNFRGLGTALLAGYVFMPLAAWGAGRALLLGDGQGMEALFVGLLIVGALPCPLASAVIWTRLGGGNDALALAVTVVSNGINFLVAPVIFLCIVPAWVEMGEVTLAARLLGMIGSIFLVVGLPVGAAQLARISGKVRSFADRRQRELSVVVRIIILTVVLIAVSRAVVEIRKLADGAEAGAATGAAGEMSFATKLAAVLAGTVVIHVLALLFARTAAGLARCPPGDRLAVMMSGSQKTLPVGIFFASAFFPAYPLAVVPIIVYHAVQLTIDSFVVSRAGRRAAAAAAKSGGAGGLPP